MIPWVAGAFPNRDYVAKQRHSVSHPRIPWVQGAVNFFLLWILWVHGAFFHSLLDRAQRASLLRALLLIRRRTRLKSSTSLDDVRVRTFAGVLEVSAKVQDNGTRWMI